MTTADEPLLHALCVEPRCARAGETVRIVFRTRNLGTQPSPPGRVVFALDVGLDALGAVEVDVEPAAPGSWVSAEVRVRVAVPVDDGARLAVRAALHVPGAVLATNVCTVTARSRGVLDGPASGTFVTAAAMDGTEGVGAAEADVVRVRAVIVNEGDGPARALHVTVPAPLGCVRADGDGPAVLDLDRLEPGERAELSFTARIVEPVGEIRVDGGDVRLGDGRRIALPARDGVVLAAVMAPPHVAVTPSRRCAAITVDVRNDGWVDARDVRVRIAMPDGMRPVEDGITVDGVPLGGGSPHRRAPRASRKYAGADASVAPLVAYAERDGDAHAIVVSLVPARSAVRVEMLARVTTACGGGAISVTVGEHRVAVPFAPDRVRELRARVLASPRTASPGEVVRMTAHVVNAGDAEETVAASIADRETRYNARLLTLAPGAAATVELAFQVPDDAGDGDVLERSVVVDDASGTREEPAEHARATFSLAVRDRAWLSLDEPVTCSGGSVRYVVRNDGCTTAREATATFDDTTVPFGSIEPGAIAAIEVDEDRARHGGSVSVAGRDVLALPRANDCTHATVHAALHAPEHVVAGAAFMVRLDLDVEDAVETLTVTVPRVCGCAYVPGSTVLDACALLDRTGTDPATCESNAAEQSDAARREPTSPLDGDGLALRDVPAGSRVSLAWSLIAGMADADAPTITATVTANGERHQVAPVTVRIRARDPFAARPRGLRYHVDGCAVAPAEAPERPARSNAALEGRQASVHAGAASNLPSEEHGLTVPASRCHDAFAADTLSVAEPPVSHDRPRITFGMRLDDERRGAFARLAQAARSPGLVGHLFLVRLFFPDTVAVGDAVACGSQDDAFVLDALALVRDGVRDAFDRLFVKLRIPGFAVCSDDLEDPPLRDALYVLFERLLDVAPERIAFAESPSAFDRDAVRSALSALADAPLGAPAVLRALVALLPASCDDDPALAAALRRHAALLDDILSSYDGRPLEVFDDALANRADGALDDARDRVLALASAHALAEAAR